MRKMYLFFFLLVASTAFCQIEPDQMLLKDLIDDIKNGNPMENAEVIHVIVNGKEIEKPEDYFFQILDLEEVKITRDANIDNDEKRISFTIAIKTVLRALKELELKYKT